MFRALLVELEFRTHVPTDSNPAGPNATSYPVDLGFQIIDQTMGMGPSPTRVETSFPGNNPRPERVETGIVNIDESSSAEFLLIGALFSLVGILTGFLQKKTA